MTEDHRAEVLAELNGNTQFRTAAHYYALAMTGTPAVDILVSAVNSAGRTSIYTEDWFATGSVDRINAAAKITAEQYRTLESALGRVMALHSPNERPGMCPVCFVNVPCSTIRAITETGDLT